MLQAERDYDLNRAAELKYGTLIELQRQLKSVEEALARKAAGAKLLKEEVTESDIAEIVSKWTGENKEEEEEEEEEVYIIMGVVGGS